MDGETVETVTGWESEPLSGGIDGLRTLQSREFTGAVTEGHAWLFMLNGRVVGVFDGSLDSFADADGTAYAAPDPSLPLLYAMRERGGETKARYYTNDTALSAADAKLSSGKFTGYIELSENVLSGDYYVVYYGGRRLACAFVGTGEQKQVLTGDEAFEAADDEVGIYEVVDVDVDVVDIPEPEPEPESEPDPDPDRGPDAGSAVASAGPDDTVGDDPSAGGNDSPGDDSSTSITFGGADASTDADDSATNADAGDDESDQSAPTGTASDVPDAPNDTGGVEGGSGESDDPPADAAATERGSDSTAASNTTGEPDESVGTDEAADPTAGAPAAEDDATAGPTRSVDDLPAEDGAATGTDPAQPARPAASRSADPSPDAGEAGEPGGDGDPFSAEEQWRETRSIPSLDPSRTATPEAEGTQANGATEAAERRRRDRSAHGSASRAGETGRGDRPGTVDSDARQSGDRGDGGSARVEGPADASEELAAAREALATARAERDRAVEGAREAREQLESNEDELDRLREENARLSERVDELETELAETREELAEARERASSGDGTDDGMPANAIPADRALAGTNLFVRYESKGGATLEKAHAGGASRSDVNDNLRLELHTDFDAADAAVEGRPFREFLTDTIEYGFVEWAVRELLYEIQSTGNESALRDLFDALPAVDRAELDGTVTVDDADGGATEHTFDVVLRDRMGNPLVVADVTEGRDATTESMLDGLVGDASAVADADDHLAAGFYVTASFFDPGALEAAADATGGGLLSRGKRKSFVKLSRKQGFHLCLVESRDGEFHVNVPEL
ncbi:hypothetical protein GRX01_11880 [Halobaculum sp. WSA2]|uniref:DUF7527 domain-containing protein n=1 Tax=Halobaculum saliterrae TaxID=2073113 RepID=A0A6B0SZN0_9EURY|nr:hypothetical protein [Halobaculum saliterrae]MXR42033.1 hypothetical protein [Halobaculum saliterrae]